MAGCQQPLHQGHLLSLPTWPDPCLGFFVLVREGWHQNEPMALVHPLSDLAAAWLLESRLAARAGGFPPFFCAFASKLGSQFYHKNGSFGSLAFQSMHNVFSDPLLGHSSFQAGRGPAALIDANLTIHGCFCKLG